MSIKILTKSGEEITHIDDARAYNFDAGNKSGIVKGALNEGKLFLVSSNVIGLDSCELRISGHRIVIDSAESITMANRPSVATRYSMIAEVVVSDASVPSFRLFIQPAKTELIQQNLYKTLNGNGTYQLRIGNFTLGTDGNITDIVRTADIISGGANNGVGDIEFNATVETISSDLQPEVNVDYNEETRKYDMHFALPKGSGTNVKVGGVTQTEISFDSNPQEQLNNKADKVVGATENNLASLDADGNLKDSGVASGDVATKVVGAIAGNIASLDTEGNIKDSGIASESVVTTNTEQTITENKLFAEGKGIRSANGSVLKIEQDTENVILGNYTHETRLNGNKERPTYNTSSGSFEIALLGNSVVETVWSNSNVANTQAEQTVNATKDLQQYKGFIILYNRATDAQTTYTFSQFKEYKGSFIKEEPTPVISTRSISLSLRPFSIVNFPKAP